MIFEEMLREEKQEGREEGRLEATQEAVLELLEESGEIPCELQEKIRNLENLETLKVLLKLAARADSLHTFEEKAEEYFNSEDKERKIGDDSALPENKSAPVPLVASGVCKALI